MKYDVSNKISETVADYGVSHRQIARAAGVSPSTISRASKAGYMVTKPVRDAIDYGCNKLSMHTPTAVIAANLEKQVDVLRDTVAFSMSDFKSADQMPKIVHVGLPNTPSGLVDDAIESAHSREKAELQKALAARISEVEELTDDVAYWKKESYDGDELLKAEREKGLDTLNQLLRAEDLLKTERLKNETQYQSIGQCFAEIKRLQGDLKDAQSVISVQEKQIDLGLDENDRLKRLVALRTQDLAVYQKELEAADNRADDAEYKAAEFERDLVVQRAWTWFFLVLSFVAAVVGVVK